MPTKMQKTGRLLLTSTAMIAVLVIGSSCGGGGGGGFFGGVSRVVGQALAPIQGVIDSNPIPLGDAPVQLLDFADQQARTSRLTDVGRTDANGNYSVDVQGQAFAAVIVNGAVGSNPIRISGLLNPDSANVSKNFSGITDVACEAGVTAVMEGALAPEDFRDGQRIRNLEAGASRVLATTPVNFFDPASVTAASVLVRSLTNDGRIAPEGTETATDDSCQGGRIVKCADGTQICSNVTCDGKNDCPDASDESAALCTEAKTCCNATAGCPTETAEFCGQGCCCCPIRGLVCDRDNFDNGCISGRSAGALTARDQESPLLKLLNLGDL